MFKLFDYFRKRLSYDQLQTLQTLCQQVVLLLEGSVHLAGAAKKAEALKLVKELLQDLGIVAPDSLIDVTIEASVKLLKALEPTLSAAKARPPSGLESETPGTLSKKKKGVPSL